MRNKKVISFHYPVVFVVVYIKARFFAVTTFKNLIFYDLCSMPQKKTISNSDVPIVETISNSDVPIVEIK